MPIMTLPATHNTANCVVVDGHVCCESRSMSMHDTGWAILCTLLFITWLGIPLTRYWSGWVTIVWYAVPPFLTAIGFLVFG